MPVASASLITANRYTIIHFCGLNILMVGWATILKKKKSVLIQHFLLSAAAINSAWQDDMLFYHDNKGHQTTVEKLKKSCGILAEKFKKQKRESLMWFRFKMFFLFFF